MPTYEYACRDCSEHVEVVQSMHDAPLTTCTHCGGNLRKVFSPIGVVFKGSGFYRNDSRTTKAPVSAATAEASSTASNSDASPAAASGKDPASAPSPAPAAAPSSTTAPPRDKGKDKGKRDRSASAAPSPASNSKRSA